MNKRINKLDKLTANKIAAGEVVDRPASVIKELVENAIDAGSTKIIVEIRGGGKEYIRVTDNGIGIYDSDVFIAFERHATSKLISIGDLDDLLSLGFRGEALASIASVSQVELITKTKDALTGTYLGLHGGEIKEHKEMGCPQGTTLVVKNLFYNTPARFQFMKSTATETGFISDLMSKFALAHPHISFRFINNGTIVFATSGSGNVINNIASIYGKEIAKNMYEASTENDFVSIKAYVSKPSMARGNKQLQGFFVNGRYIKSKMISDAVLDAYKTLLMVNKFPICFIYINISPKHIDVNIHPTKMEIRFSHEEMIKGMIVDAINRALLQEDLIPKVNFHENKQQSSKVENIIDLPKVIPNEARLIKKEPSNFKMERNRDRVVEEPKQMILEDKSSYITNNIVKGDYQIGIDSKEKEKKHDEITNKRTRPNIVDIRILGQIFDSYLIGQDIHSLYLIDQHAAHERILYDWMIKKYEDQSILSQKLLIPILVELSYSEFQVVKDHDKHFYNLGFEIEEFGTNAYILRAVPIVFGEPEAKKFFLEVVNTLLRGVHNSYGLRMEKIISMACKSAVKAKDKLNELEIIEMMNKLSELENPFTCPHGRPIIIAMTKNEIEKKFKRI